MRSHIYYCYGQVKAAQSRDETGRRSKGSYNDKAIWAQRVKTHGGDQHKSVGLLSLKFRHPLSLHHYILALAFHSVNSPPIWPPSWLTSPPLLFLSAVSAHNLNAWKHVEINK